MRNAIIRFIKSSGSNNLSGILIDISYCTLVTLMIRGLKEYVKDNYHKNVVSKLL